MTEHFYSDRTRGHQPRIMEEITQSVWRGLVSLVERRVDDGSMAREFPDRTCPDGSSIPIGTDEDAFYMTLSALVPDLPCPDNPYGRPHLDPTEVPSSEAVLDLVDFVGQRIAEPSNRTFHSYYGHDHIWFNGDSPDAGKTRFRDDVELLFARNGIAFTIGDGMCVQRLAPMEARPLVHEFAPRTGDTVLDEKLVDAVTRFRSRNVRERVDGLEKLWDAFERMKTLELEDRKQKSASIQQLIERATASSALREHLNEECRALTKIGNNFAIRHHEHGAEQLPTPIGTSIDYLFIRLLGLISYLLRQTDRL